MKTNDKRELRSSTAFGIAGEQATADLLSKQGFKLLHTNYRKPYGEIDIIAATHELLVFVEVKSRTVEYFDSTDLITRSKQKKIIMVAKEYMARHGIGDMICRFDVALVISHNGQPSICYIPDAFGEHE